MKLSLGELLHGGSAFSTIFSKAHRKQTQQCRGGEVVHKLDRNSVELHKTRLQTRKCSRENMGMTAACEELLCVIPRQDSITLAKRRLSHDVHATSDTAVTATGRTPCSTTANSWQITAEQTATTA